MSTTGTVIIVRPTDSIRKPARASTAIVAFWLAAFGAFSIFTLGEEKYPACRAATEKVDYGNGLSIPENTRALMESYREDWRTLCSMKGGSKPSLAKIFEKAKQIEADFKKIFDTFDESIINEANFDSRRSAAIHDLVSNKFPTFVPAFKGAYGEHEMFSPSIDAFRKSVPLGNAEDRTFFENQLSLDGDFPPYITKTWDYGGCDRYGEFDWTGTLKNIAHVKKQVTNSAYLKETTLLEEGLFRELGTSYDICTCKKKEAVIQDLVNVQKYIRKEAVYASQIPKVQHTIDSIQSGKIQVKSEAEKHCSGG
jgi:hypothetical protein